MNLLKPVEDDKNSLTLDLITNVSGVLGAALIGDPTGIAAAVIPRIINEVIHQVISPLTTRSESKRLYQWGKLAAEGIAQRLNKCEEFRKDGFFEETPTNRSNFEEVVESTLKKVKDATEEPKIKFYAKLTENIHIDEDLDMHTYRQILNDLDALTYRQLCIIRLATLCENSEVDISRYDNLEEIPQNEHAKFHSISRDYEKMMVDDSYLDGVRGMKTENGEPCMFMPSLARSAYQSNQLYLFANLCEIPPEDIEKTFSIWHVRVKNKSNSQC